MVIDAVNCKNTGDKIRWAYGLITGNPKRGIIFGQLEILVRLMDEVEFRGFTHGPTEDERDEMVMYYTSEPLHLRNELHNFSIADVRLR